MTPCSGNLLCWPEACGSQADALPTHSWPQAGLTSNLVPAVAAAAAIWATGPTAAPRLGRFSLSGWALVTHCSEGSHMASRPAAERQGVSHLVRKVSPRSCGCLPLTTSLHTCRLACWHACLLPAATDARPATCTTRKLLRLWHGAAHGCCANRRHLQSSMGRLCPARKHPTCCDRLLAVGHLHKGQIHKDFESSSLQRQCQQRQQMQVRQLRRRAFAPCGAG